MAMEYLVITADDLGYSKERNEGIIKCFMARGITRASLMVNAVAAEHGLSLAREYGLPIGLHLNLSEGSPVSPVSMIPSLVTDEGYMHSKMGVRKHNTAGLLDYKQVEIEIKAQIEKFEEMTGKLPFYVDGHQHVHVLPGIRQVFAETLQEYGIHESRLPVEDDISQWSWIYKSSRDFYQTISEDARGAREVFKKHSIRFPEGFVGWGVGGKNLSAELVKGMISKRFQKLRIKKFGGQRNNASHTVELMVHPGYPTAPESGGCGQGPDSFAQCKDRQHEISVLVSKEFADVCKDYVRVAKLC